MNFMLLDILKALDRQTEVFKQIAEELKALNEELRKEHE